MEKRKLSEQILIFFQNARHSSSWEKLVKPRKRTTQLTLQEECREALKSHRAQSPRGSLTKEEQTLQPGNWRGIRHYTKSQVKEPSRYSYCTPLYPSSPSFVIPLAKKSENTQFQVLSRKITCPSRGTELSSHSTFTVSSQSHPNDIKMERMSQKLQICYTLY